MSSEEKFLAYDFESNGEWKTIEGRLEVVDSAAFTAVLLKKKRQFYQKNIDPDYKLPEVASPRPSAAPEASSSRSSTSSDSSSSSSGTSTPSSAGARASSSSTPSSGTSRPSGSVPGAPVSRINATISYLQFLSHAATVLFSILFLVSPVLGEEWQQMAWSRAIQLSAFVNIVHILKTYGRPRFSKEYAASVFPDDTTHFLFLSILLLNAKPSIVALFPIASRALFFFCRGLKYALRNNASISAKLAPLLERVISRQSERAIWQMNAQMEIFAGFQHLFGLLSADRNLLALFMWWQYLRMRYILSGYTKAAFAQIGATIDRYCPGAARPLWTKARSLLAGMVAVPTNEEEAKKMKPSCVIM